MPTPEIGRIWKVKRHMMKDVEPERHLPKNFSRKSDFVDIELPEVPDEDMLASFDDRKARGGGRSMGEKTKIILKELERGVSISELVSKYGYTRSYIYTLKRKHLNKNDQS